LFGFVSRFDEGEILFRVQFSRSRLVAIECRVVATLHGDHVRAQIEATSLIIL
jgi:hypothetical protein